MFSHQAKNVEPILAENSLPRDNDKHQLYLRASQLTLSAQQEIREGEIRESPKNRKCSIQLDSTQHKQAADSENASGSSKNESCTSIEQVQKTHSERMRKVYQKQMEEFEKFKKNREKILEKEKEDMEIKHNLESGLIRHLVKQLPDKSEKLKMLDQEFARKKEELSTRMETQQKFFEAMQWRARDEENQMRDQWLEEAKSGRSVAIYATLPLSDSGFREENMEGVEQVIVGHENSGSGIRVEPIDDSGQGGVVHEVATRSSLEKQDSNRGLSVFPVEVVPVEICAKVPNEVDEIVATEPPLLTMPLGEEVNTLISESATDTGSKQQRRLCSSHSCSPSWGKTLIGTPLNREQAASSHDGQVPPFQVPGDQHAQPSVPAFGFQGIEVSRCEVQNLSQVETQISLPIESLQSNQVDDNTPLPAVQLQLSPSADPPSTEQSQSDVPTCATVGREQTNEFLQQFEVQIRSPLEGQNEHLNHSDSLHENQFRHTTAQRIQIPAQPQNIQQTELLNNSGSPTYPQPRQHMPMESSVSVTGSRLSNPRSMCLSPDFSPLLPHISPVSSQISQQLCPDPLQNELGRICREGEQAVKMHEDEKMRLNSECKKKVEEIQRKYNTMLQDAEMEFMQRKKALETNYNMVHMNWILGGAFRLKCDGRLVGASGLKQGASSRSMQQAGCVSSSQVARTPASLRSQPTVPPVQMVNQPSALFSSNRVRSQLGQALSSHGNHQIETESCAPAPHLQPFRPVISIPAASLSPLSWMLPGQQSLSNSTTVSIHPPHIPRLPMHKSGSFARAHQSENVGGL